MTVLEMVERANARIEAGLAPPLDVSAILQSNFAYFARESGREDLAEPMARAALRRADLSADPSARLIARQTLAETQLRLGRCAEALSAFREADALLARSRNAIAPVLAASFLSARASSKSRCESDPAAAVRLLEEALARSAALRPAESAVPPAVFRAALFNSYAIELSRLRRFEDARNAIAQGLALAESHPDGRYFQLSLLRIRGQVETNAGNPAAALESFERAAALAPGTASAFEELRLQLMAAARQAETGHLAAAAARARATLEQARARFPQIGPSFWMLLNDAAEVHARSGQCQRAFDLYRESDTLTAGRLPNDWRGNRLFFEAECYAASNPARAAALAREAAQVYGLLLHPDSARARRLRELTALR
jgi:tetratricopeptide (TPR) repeat protein